MCGRHGNKGAEYNNTGKGSSTTQRVDWMKSLTTGEAQDITLKNVMGKFYEKMYPALHTTDYSPSKSEIK